MLFFIPQLIFFIRIKNTAIGGSDKNDQAAAAAAAAVAAAPMDIFGK